MSSVKQMYLLHLILRDCLIFLLLENIVIYLAVALYSLDASTDGSIPLKNFLKPFRFVSLIALVRSSVPGLFQLVDAFSNLCSNFDAVPAREGYIL